MRGGEKKEFLLGPQTEPVNSWTSLWTFARLRLCLNNTLRILQGLLAGRLAQECQLKSLKQPQDAADILSLQISLLMPRCFI